MVCTMQVPDIGFQGYPLSLDKALCAGEPYFSLDINIVKKVYKEVF